jgi:hypothetical protein
MDLDKEFLWIGISTSLGSTYSETEYKDHEIDYRFAHIKSLDDVEKYENYINTTINSPTWCYVHVDKKEGIFYRDQQDCVIWQLDKKTGYVKSYGQEEKFVAKSIPEFLSHVFSDSQTWYLDWKTNM